MNHLGAVAIIGFIGLYFFMLAFSAAFMLTAPAPLFAKAMGVIPAAAVVIHFREGARDIGQLIDSLAR